MSLGGWGLANPWGLAFGLLAVPIVVLHILRPRRIQATVAALFLWRRVATPVTAARPWQRLVPSWLLAAQVLAALLLAVAVAQPVRLTEAVLAEHTVFVIDASASMQANDGAPDRLASAQDRASALRRQVPAGGTASLIAAGSEARALLTNSADVAAFDEAVRTIEAFDGAGDIDAAFALAAGLDTGRADTRVVFVSDGGIEPADLRAAPVGTRYEAVGSSATNRAITQLSVEPAAEGLTARIAVTHFGGPAASQRVRVDVDGVTVASQMIELEPGAVVNLTLPLPVGRAGGERIEAFLEGEDALALDNRAVATVARRPAVEVLWAGPDNPFLAAALGATPGVTVTRAEAIGDTIDPAIDLVVADRVAVPDGLDLPLLTVAPVGGARGIVPSGTVERPVLSLVRDDLPLVQGLDLSQVFVAEAQRLEVPAGAEVVLGAEGAPLLVQTRIPAPTVYVAFPLDASTLPLELAFPILMDRVVGQLTDLVAPPPRLTVGTDLPIDPRLEATIVSPDGTSATIPPGSSYPRADRIGFWEVRQDGRQLLVAVGAARAESAIAPAPELAFETAFAGRGPAPRPGELPLVWPVVALLLALLAAEWLLARRRLGVGPRQWRLATGARVAVAAALVAVLVLPDLNRPANEVATVFLVDASDSMTQAGRARAADLVRQAVADQPEGTRAGVVAFGGDARLETVVSDQPTFAGLSVVVDPGATDLSAALRLGAAALPADARRRLVLISDGRATTGDAMAEADRLSEDGIPIDVIVTEPASGTDLAVAGVDVPPLARNGEQIDIDVRLVSPADTDAEVILSRDGQEVGRRNVALTPGETTVRFTDVASSDGVLRYQVTVTGTDDSVRANDIGFAAVPVEGADRVLVVAGRDGVAAGMVAALASAGLPTDTVTPASFPAIDELTRYASMVLVDVDRRDLSDAQVEDITAAVRDLGRGLLVVGGTRSYALGGYRDSDLEQILPVISEITDPLRRQSVAQVLAIDSSGSMGACHCDEEGRNGLGGGNRLDGGVSKTVIARTATARAIAALAATDEVGVLSMDADDRWVIDLQAAPPPEVVDAGLNQIVPDGPTFLDTGLETAATALRQSEASLKHIIVFSDGFTEPGGLVEMAEQAERLVAEGITVSVVATGEGAAEDLRPIADAGGGRFYPGRNLEQIPDLIVQEAVLASRDFVNEGEFLPLIASARPPVANLAASPVLLGYVATSAKPTATVDLRIGPDEDPLLASWRAGLGRVSAWTSDGGERWSVPWNGWDGGPDFWAAVVKDTFPVTTQGGSVGARIVDGQLELRLEGADDWPDDASATVSVAGPDGSSTVVALERIDGTTFGATTPVDAAGTYALGAVVDDGTDTVWSGVGLATRSYPAEYAPRPPNRDSLVDLAARTGGRVDPEVAALFSPEGTTAGVSRLDLTRWLLLFAVLAWPLAVALSRLSWRRGLLAEGAGRAASTVSVLRTRLPRIAEPTLPGPGGPAPSGAGPSGAGPSGSPVVVAPPPVEPSARPSPAAAPAQPREAAPGDGPSTVSELLARKRENRQQPKRDS